MSWKHEHPKARVPKFISEHKQLSDLSWHNDTMPSFQVSGLNLGQRDVRLWVDYADKKLRESSEAKNRYCVQLCEWDTSDVTVYYEGDDMEKAVAILIEKSHALLHAKKYAVAVKCHGDGSWLETVQPNGAGIFTRIERDRGIFSSDDKRLEPFFNAPYEVRTVGVL